MESSNISEVSRIESTLEQKKIIEPQARVGMGIPSDLNLRIFLSNFTIMITHPLIGETRYLIVPWQPPAWCIAFFSSELPLLSRDFFPCFLSQHLRDGLRISQDIF